MATYLELESLRNDSELFSRVRVATWIAADQVRAEAPATTNHTARLAWAKEVYEQPDAKSRQMFWACLAANRGASLAAIQGATDAQIQAVVDTAIDLFAV